MNIFNGGDQSKALEFFQDSDKIIEVKLGLLSLNISN